jgi:hypothetical protein
LALAALDAQSAVRLDHVRDEVARDWPAFSFSSWPGLSRPSTPSFAFDEKNVDAPVKPGHDERNFVSATKPYFGRNQGGYFRARA